MNNSLFSLLCQMEGSEIASKLLPVLLNNEFSSVLPDDEKILQEVFSDPPPTPTQLANQMNEIAIELIKAYLELNVVDEKNREHLKQIIVYREQFDEDDASKSYFSIQVSDKRYINPTESDLYKIIEEIKAYENNFLNNGLHLHKNLFIYADEKLLSDVRAIDPNIFSLPYDYDSRLSYLIEMYHNPNRKEIIDIISESSPYRFKNVSLETYAFLVLCKIA